MALYEVLHPTVTNHFCSPVALTNSSKSGHLALNNCGQKLNKNYGFSFQIRNTTKFSVKVYTDFQIFQPQKVEA